MKVAGADFQHGAKDQAETGAIEGKADTIKNEFA
jgi:hypothetical protein